MIARVTLASTPADRFAAPIRAIQAGIERLPDAVVRLILGDLDAARRQILGQLVNVDPGGFPAYRFTALEGQLRDVMDRFVEKYGETPGRQGKGPRKPLPEELARDAIAHEDEAPGGKGKMPFRIVLARQDAEALAAWSIRDEKNLVLRCSFSAPPGS